jgi:hypothetical protein
MFGGNEVGFLAAREMTCLRVPDDPPSSQGKRYGVREEEHSKPIEQRKPLRLTPGEGVN